MRVFDKLRQLFTSPCTIEDTVSVTSVAQDASAAQKEILLEPDDVCTPRDDEVSAVQQTRVLGASFQQSVITALSKVSKELGGTLFHNIVLLLQGMDSRTTELDIVLVFPQCVFVVECKDWQGVFYANHEEQPFWVRVSRNGKGKRFYSPVRQNATHIRALSNYLDLHCSNIVSVVVMSNRSVLYKLPTTSFQQCIGHLDVVLPFIQKRVSTSSNSIPALSYVLEKLQVLQNDSDRLLVAHNAQMNVQKHPDKCPLCGHQLVIRSVKKTGEAFLGCSMYPNCRYTRTL